MTEHEDILWLKVSSQAMFRRTCDFEVEKAYFSLLALDYKSER